MISRRDNKKQAIYKNDTSIVRIHRSLKHSFSGGTCLHNKMEQFWGMLSFWSKFRNTRVCLTGNSFLVILQTSHSGLAQNQSKWQEHQCEWQVNTVATVHSPHLSSHGNSTKTHKLLFHYGLSTETQLVIANFRHAYPLWQKRRTADIKKRNLISNRGTSSTDLLRMSESLKTF